MSLAIALGLALLCALALVGWILLMTRPWPASLSALSASLPVECVVIPTEGGIKLAAWYCEGAPGRGAIVLMHGVCANRSVLVERLRFLREAGYGVLALDLRAHGESEGDEITYGLLESRDSAAAVAWLRGRLPGVKIGAIGISLGGAACLLGPEPLDIDALVLESVFPDIFRAVDGRLTRYLGSLGHAITPIFLEVARLITGLDPQRLRPIDGLRRVSGPVFLISGTQDRNTRIEEAREMFAVASEPKIYWEVEGAAHVDLENFAPEEYRRRVLAFFADALS